MSYLYILLWFESLLRGESHENFDKYFHIRNFEKLTTLYPAVAEKLVNTLSKETLWR